MIKDVSSYQSSFHLHPTVSRVETQRSEGKLDKVIEQLDRHQLPSKEDLEKVVKGMNDFLKPSNTHLKFAFHEELKEYYVSIVDNETNKIVKEIPPKKLLDMYAAMTEYLGLLVDKKI